MNFKEQNQRYKNERKTARLQYRQKKSLAKEEYKSSIVKVRDRFDKEIAAGYRSIGKEPPKNPPSRSVLEEIGNATTHGVGAIFAIVAFILMLLNSNGGLEVLGAVIYFFGMFVMFTMSCLYHSFKHGTKTKRIFRRFDYSSIYLLIGATFAPILLCFRGGVFGTVFFVIQWLIIATGVSLVGVFGPSRLRFIHIPLYVLLGWSGLMLIPSMYAHNPMFVFWILLGGVVYSFGIIPFAIKSRASHFIWHFFVLAGAILQWIGVFKYIYLL